ncbi:hypothetical protein [Urbanus proteus nucleopolyhedrovirus]|uniref:Uncharacterized protein n=1 Tax=Urbanus proteus nucleopolyhedrovirus TaxID=1675866 RepID=A0A162GV50_9ABAC|nr:hypothetical protein [Urbanus proteus nucleopolyhedrovirus]AKR17396.1 hypothetical protein [Urbanus proteus nucleopolyhedrovirus]
MTLAILIILIISISSTLNESQSDNADANESYKDSINNLLNYIVKEINKIKSSESNDFSYTRLIFFLLIFVFVIIFRTHLFYHIKHCFCKRKRKKRKESETAHHLPTADIQIEMEFTINEQQNFINGNEHPIKRAALHCDK